ncbi:FTR1 family iron permease [Streptococcus loxodontisalivarius]|uniref:High-affinity iron transporter n=1 Tax=Streptococcus loxodontisalivarius TaxID=1349415 RepID=A0ABS2PP68_9STRE|nr:FTR1 family protein [Streptococcus loxodontisalivarius]MBM7641822.1 high-affinity iron transporter [Streptococcus loxodontisalivarius]
MVKTYLNKLILVTFLGIALLFSQRVSATSYSDLFIKITDAQTALKEDNQSQALQLIQEVGDSFSQVENADSTAGKAFSQAVTKATKDSKITNDELTELSTALLAFEEEQNPVDLEAEKADFKKKVYPALENLEEVINIGDVEAMKTEYLTFNSIWTRNESVVRSSEGGHYGTIESAMSFLRASMEAEPFDLATVQSNVKDLRTAIDNFMDGKSATSSSDVKTLSEGIELLKDAYDDFTSGDTAAGQKKMKTFISNWTTFEGEVSTRSSALYSKVESQTPLIMAKGASAEYQEKLKSLISELEAINTDSSYSALDAMVILLREGVEALLIVMALVEALRYSKQKRGIKWVYGGALAGIAASGIAAALLQMLFPTVTSGTNREIIEGAVGLFAVVMLIGVGIWLHGKSNVKAWNAYMERQMNLAMSTGSFLSMFALSFLSVFREGAETILFYVGILPKISSQNLIMGIGLAILALVIIAVLINRFSKVLPMHWLFRILTWTIYILAFKMLGVSINALQLTNILPNHVLDFVPSIDWLGIYSSLETSLAQLCYIIVIFALNVWMSRRQKAAEHG